MGEDKNPTSYVQRQSRRWKQELEKDPERDPVITVLFRAAIMEAMPTVVKAKLEDVVGLNSKTTREFCDHVTHAVEQYRKSEQKMKNQERELQRRLTQLQLDDLVNKKKKIQANIKDVEDQSAVMAAVNIPNPAAQAMPQAPAPMGQSTSNTTGNQQQPSAPIVIYLPEQQNRLRPNGGRGRGRGRQNNNQQRTSDMCWGCNQPGHIKRNCCINPWPQNEPLRDQMYQPGQQTNQNQQNSLKKIKCARI